MSRWQEVGGAILDEVMVSLKNLGLSPEDAAELTKETSALSFILLDPSASEDAKLAAKRALQGIPIRMKQKFATAQAEVVQRAEQILDGFLAVLDKLVSLVLLA